MTTQQAAESGHLIVHTLRAEGADASEDGTGRGTPIIPIDMRQASRGEKFTNNRTDGGPTGIGVGIDGDPAFTVSERGQAIAYRTSGNCGVMEQGDKTAALNCGTDLNQNIVAYQCHGSNVGPMGTVRAGNGNETGGVPFVMQERSTMRVRRLTPRETERLQGFPDDWTRYGADGEEVSDSARYRMIGNSVAVPCVEWIARRIVRSGP